MPPMFLYTDYGGGGAVRCWMSGRLPGSYPRTTFARRCVGILLRTFHITHETPHRGSAKSFHEKAGVSQDGFVFTCMCSLP
jgi:hypothetical protein